MVKLNKVKQRLVYLAPAVQAGWDDESSIADFAVIELLGQGSFGRVKKMKHKKTGKIYAIKEIDKKEIKSRKMVDQVKNQLKIMYSLNHPNIVKLYSHFEDDFSIYLIMEYAENGHMYSYLMKSQKKRIPEEQAQHFIGQIAAAIEYVHLKGIIHRDIKPQNILLDSKMNAKLCDFGWSNFQKGPLKRTTYCGTLDYLAPQMLLEGHAHDSTVDIWALGVLIYEFCSGNSPFSFGLTDNGQSQKKVKLNISKVKYTTVPSYLSESCKQLITRILKKQPKQRPTIKQILSSPWLQKTQIVQQKDYAQQLKKQFQSILQQTNTFSKQQIYNFSRVQSVINQKKPDGLQKQDSRPYNLETKIKQLQLKRAQDQQQLYRLRKFKQDHTECDKKIIQLQKSYTILKTQADSYLLKLTSSEARIRELQMQISKTK